MSELKQPRTTVIETGQKFDYSPGAFREHFGSLGFEGDQLERIIADASTFYIDLEYHNFDHALETAWRAMELAEAAQERELVNVRALFVAALYHDAGYHEDHKAQGYTSKEALSAAVFVERAGIFGLEQNEIVVGNQAIAATYPTATCRTIEDDILVQADLTSISEKSLFNKGTARLMDEEIRIKGDAFNEVTFKARSIWALANYLTEDLAMGKTDDWQRLARVNVQRRYIEYVNQFGGEFTESIRGMGEIAVNQLIELVTPKP